MLTALVSLMLNFSPGKEAAVLSSSSFLPIVERFNADDVAAGRHEALSIPNDAAWSFMESNIPWFDCPDKQLAETYYYRWWNYRKHLAKTPAGWVVTEFLPQVSWAGVYNTISCAASHHLYEGRWLRDPSYMRDAANFWFYPEAEPRKYSFWAADSVRAVTLATGDPRLAERLLPNLVANYRNWERDHLDPSGLFHQVDDRDGMEFSLGGSGYRPTINSYMYGDAQAIAAIADEAGEPQLAKEFHSKALAIKGLVQERLWNSADRFFETPNSKVREEVGFVPWYFHLPDPSFSDAWAALKDPNAFNLPYGPPTAERRAAGFMHPEDHDCLWNGPSWPYATTQTLVGLANLLNDYPASSLTSSDYFDLLLKYSRSQQKDGRPWIAEDLDPVSGKWIVDLPRSVNYNHSGFSDLVISGLVGVRPRPDNKLVVRPLIPSGTWPWFCLDAVPYHGQSLTVLWDADGSHYGRGAGMTLLVNGHPAAHRADLGELMANLPPVHTPKLVSWVKHDGPVLGGKLGTCFDQCTLQEGKTYRMYFSWRPKKSIALVESQDGVHWGEPKIVLGPASTGWEDDMNRPSVIEVGGQYRMWYTGQFSGRSSIGTAMSEDGVHWNRLPNPVLEAKQPWEKGAVMCPSVLWDDHRHVFRMWYSGGDQYEPDAIGYATSPDGVAWTKHDGPIFSADPASRWEQYKVTACQVTPWHGEFLMFYIGFRDIDHAQIGIARSPDGMGHWQRLPSNPILSPTVEGWDADACYKPFAIYDSANKRWMLWYNGRHGGLEQIGLATKSGEDLGFPR